MSSARLVPPNVCGRERSSLSHVYVNPIERFDLFDCHVEVRKKKKGTKFKDRKESVISETTHKSSIES